MAMSGDDVTKVFKVWKQLEPDALEGANFTLLDRAALSTAVSLKRIADALSCTGPTENKNLFDLVSDIASGIPQRGDHG